MPIFRPNGAFFGTLCAIDPRPAQLNKPEVIGMFRLFASLVAFYLEAQDRVATSEAKLLGERQGADLRDQFIAVLGHDLRNPLASIDAGAKLLQKEPLNSKSAAILELVQSSVKRMAGLIDDVLDFARGRLGGGLSLHRDADHPLGPVLEQVVNELRAAWPRRVIETHLAVVHAVNCDPGRIAQLLSNLVGNALKHGAADGPVQIWASTDGNMFELAVANQGDPIPPETLDRLFQPFFRVANRSTYEGLGLGLYISSEIVRAHGGTLTVQSTPAETRFTVRIPLA
jgi:signal transduction histidine kinase